MRNRIHNFFLRILCRMLAVEIENGYEVHTVRKDCPGTTRLYALGLYIDYQIYLIEKDTNGRVELNRKASYTGYTPERTQISLKY